jgi:hypothetical protein
VDGRRLLIRQSQLLFVAAVAVGSLALGAGGVDGATKAPHAITLEGDGFSVVRVGTSESKVVKAVSARLGRPSGHPPSGCGGRYAQVAWHDLVLQFMHGRLSGDRYSTGTGGWSGSRVNPRLRTAEGVTLGTTLGQLRQAYRLRQSGTDFWTAGAIVFAVSGAAYPSPPTAPIYEIKVAACPAAV